MNLNDVGWDIADITSASAKVSYRQLPPFAAEMWCGRVLVNSPTAMLPE